MFCRSADRRLLRALVLRIDEAPLTGESVPVEKQEEPVEDTAGIADQHSMAFSGTLVASGQASGVVAATGTATQIGRISSLIQAVETVTTPLLRQINRFARRFTWFVMARSEEHTSELQSLMRISYAVFGLKKKKIN